MNSIHIPISPKTVLWAVAGMAAWTGLKAALAQKRKLAFRGKTVIITGGSRGLGLELARVLVQEGAHLAICARQADELSRARAELASLGGSVYTQVCDITDKQQVDHFVQTVQEVVGPVDVLINNAGVISVAPFEDTTETDFREAIDTHFWGAFYMIHAVLPQMQERARKKESAGRIVNIASIGGKLSVPHLLPYSTSKFTMVGYSEGLRAALLHQGIYVTTICPGLMRTGSPRQAFFKGQPQKEYAAFKISDSLPFLTMASDQAAREIIEACRYGKAEHILTLPAKVGNWLAGLAPNLIGEVMALVNELLPDAGGLGQEPATGHQSESVISESVLTVLTDRAAVRNNEV